MHALTRSCVCVLKIAPAFVSLFATKFVSLFATIFVSPVATKHVMVTIAVVVAIVAVVQKRQTHAIRTWTEVAGKR